jgi:anti-anti-sigma regulatory factor
VADASRVEDLRPGDHACLTFSDGEERLDLVAAIVRDGLQSGQRVLCVTDTLSQVALTGELSGRGVALGDATESGQMLVMRTAETFLVDGSFTAQRVVDLLAAQISQAATDGFSGLYITSDMSWALRPVAGLDQLMNYESKLTDLVADTSATAICQYDRHSFDTVTLAGVAAHHGFALAAATYHDDAFLRICRQYQPPGIRVSGEIDYRRADPLTLALTEALALDSHMYLNLATLDFMDGSIAGVIMQAAASLGQSQRMTMRCQPHAGKIFHALGLPDLPNVTVVVNDDQ